MSVYRRMLLIAKMAEGGASIILDFTGGVLTLNNEGRGRKITVSNSEVLING